ncbi:MAG: signal peptidase I [Ruminococcus sp.]|nr:signal peptidase I [Ruminococcus sp.]MBQ8904935.1 signal peptidase I [Ruminococcus sp.]
MSRDEKRILPSAAQFEHELNRLRNKRNRRNGVGFIIAASLMAGALIILATNLWFPVLRVVGSSMQPLLKNEDIIVCLRTDEHITEGDVIAFYHNDKVLLKRVVGLPGDVIQIDSEGTLYINDVPKFEPYASSLSLEPCDITFPVTVPDDSYFVLGDQRTTSMDSRSSSVGMISEEQIIGKALVRVWPIDTIDILQ